MKQLITFISVLLLSFPVFSQERIDTIGFCILNPDITLREAESAALFNAMKNASEGVNGVDVTTVNVRRERNGVVSNSRLSFMEVAGNVQVLKKRQYTNEDTIFVNISAIVHPIYKDSFLTVDGIKVMYVENEPISFKVSFSKDGYLYIIDAAEGEIIENGIFHKAGSVCFYPPETEEFVAVGHSSTLIFVLLNEKRDFPHKRADFETYNKWYWKLPLNIRNTPIIKTFNVVR